MYERAGEHPVKLRLLMGVNRLLLTAGMAVAVFLAFLLATVVLSPPFAFQIESTDTIDFVFSTMITVIVTGTTLVVTIGQLVLTQENGPLGDQHSRMSASMNVRGFLEEIIGAPSPADPAKLLDEVLRATAERAETVRDSLESEDEELRGEIDTFAESVVGNVETVRGQLEDAQFGSFDLVYAALNFNYDWKIHQVERIANEHEAVLTEADLTRLDELKTALTMFGPVREHIKTLYFQWSLISLSQLILYASVPALAVAGVMVGVVDANTIGGSTVGVDNVLLVIGAGFAVTLVPFLLFVAYVLRILTIAKRTLSIGPLILRDSQR